MKNTLKKIILTITLVALTAFATIATMTKGTSLAKAESTKTVLDANDFMVSYVLPQENNNRTVIYLQYIGNQTVSDPIISSTETGEWTIFNYTTASGTVTDRFGGWTEDGTKSVYSLPYDLSGWTQFTIPATNVFKDVELSSDIVVRHIDGNWVVGSYDDSNYTIYSTGSNDSSDYIYIKRAGSFNITQKDWIALTNQEQTLKAIKADGTSTTITSNYFQNDKTHFYIKFAKGTLDNIVAITLDGAMQLTDDTYRYFDNLTFSKIDGAWSVGKATSTLTFNALVKDIMSSKAEWSPSGDGFTMEDGVVTADLSQMSGMIQMAKATTLEKGKKYTLSFEAKRTAGDGCFHIFTGDWTLIKDWAQSLDDWQTFTYTIESNGNDSVFIIQSASTPASTLMFRNATLSEYVETKNVDFGSAIGSLPTVLDQEGYSVKWTIDGKEITKDTINLNTGNKTVIGTKTINNYTAKIVRADKTEETIEYTIENRAEKLAQIKLTADDAQYSYAWKAALPEELALNNAQVFEETRTLNSYKVAFKNEDGSVLAGGILEYGTVPSFGGTPTKAATAQYTYTFAGWDKTPVAVTEEAVYTATYTRSAIEYTIKFVADGQQVGEDVKYSADNLNITEPQVPTKVGYGGVWEAYTLDYTNKTVNAVYTLGEYTVSFKADGTTVATRTYTVENKNIDEPAVPSKDGYNATWESYELSTGDVVVNATYSAIGYTAKVVRADGTEEAIEYTIENRAEKLAQIKLTADDAQYSYAWKNTLPEELALNNTQVFEETRTLNSYTITFKNEDGTVLSSEKVEYGTVPTYDGTPEKAATAEYTYTFKAWDKEPSAVTEDAEYTAIYTKKAVEYTVTFVVDGNEFAKRKFTVENMTIEAPEFPAKEGYEGTWEEYTLKLENMTVNAVYTQTKAEDHFMFSCQSSIVTMLPILAVFGVVALAIRKRKETVLE